MTPGHAMARLRAGGLSERDAATVVEHLVAAFRELVAGLRLPGDR